MDNYAQSQFVGPDGSPGNDQNLVQGRVRTASDVYQQTMNQEIYLSRSPDSLRKGKWTAEEERYANKVIEYFNAGILKLDEGERGITLRAYLSQKLGCDPMRITKKYTGASCLGKRVYHAYKQSGKPEDLEKAMMELNSLEEDFRAKLNQSGRKRGNSASSYPEGHSITTPAIDALFKQPSMSSGWRGSGSHRSPPAGYSYAIPTFSHEYISSMSDISQPWGKQDNQQQLPSLAGGHAFGNLSNLFDREPSAAASSSSSSTGFFNRPLVPQDAPNSTLARQSDHFQHTGLSILSQSAHETDALGNSFAQYSPARIPPFAARSSSSGSASAGLTSTRPTVDIAIGGEDSVHKKVKVTEHDTEAASSLLGFFTQLERNSSQEDMLHFFEGVQKNVASSVTVARSPSKTSNSGAAVLSLNGAAFGPSSLLPTSAFAGGSAH